MIPPGKTTLARMQIAAFNEAQRIEISQDGRVSCGLLKEPMPDQVKLRDDFDGIVRLIDALESDPNLRDRVLERLKGGARPKAERADTEIVPVDEEVDAE
jgi:hypothetical protein